MKGMVQALLRVRTGPRPDPLPDPRGDPWSLHAPYMAAFLAAFFAALLLDPADQGLLACGAAAGLALSALVRREILRGCMTAHHSAGLILLALFHGAAAAGDFVLPAGLYLAAALGAVAAARYFAPSVAPLAGRVPYRFADVYRHQSIRFGIAGVSVGTLLALFASDAAYRVLGIALLPLALRAYSGQLLAPKARGKLWIVVAAFQVVALGVLVPSKGALAVAWMVVAGETILFVGSALLIADRTGVDPYPRGPVAVGAGALVLLFTVAIPHSVLFFVLLLLLAGIVALVFLVPAKR